MAWKAHICWVSFYSKKYSHLGQIALSHMLNQYSRCSKESPPPFFVIRRVAVGTYRYGDDGVLFKTLSEGELVQRKPFKTWYHNLRKRASFFKASDLLRPLVTRGATVLIVYNMYWQYQLLPWILWTYVTKIQYKTL